MALGLRHSNIVSLKRRSVYASKPKKCLFVFGAPSYVVDGEIFWGQDRLDFVERALRART